MSRFGPVRGEKEKAAKQRADLDATDADHHIMWWRSALLLKERANWGDRWENAGRVVVLVTTLTSARVRGKRGREVEREEQILGRKGICPNCLGR